MNEEEYPCAYRFLCPSCGHTEGHELECGCWDGVQGGGMYRYIECSNCHGRWMNYKGTWEHAPEDEWEERQKDADL